MGTIVLYLGAIVTANLLVTAFGARAVLFNAFVLVGFDIVARDRLHQQWKGSNLKLKMGLLILAGSLISYLLNVNSARVALASFIAFLSASLIDTVVYDIFYESEFAKKSALSNIASSFTDSFLFIWLVGLPLTLVPLQIIVKILGSTVWIGALTWYQKETTKKLLKQMG